MRYTIPNAQADINVNNLEPDHVFDVLFLK